MSKIDLTGVPAELRATIEAQIKADKEEAIKSRLARVKEDEDTKSKLEAYEALKLEVEQSKAEKDAIAKKSLNDEFLKQSGLLQVEQFEELKVSDKFSELESEEDRVEFVSELKQTRPELFSEQINPLGLSDGYDDGKSKSKEQDGSLVI